MKRDEFESELNRFFDDLTKRFEIDENEPEDPASRPEDDPLIHELVRSFMLWRAPRAGVAAAVTRLRDSVVDYNELRISLCDENAAVIGSRYPAAHDRCQRMRCALKEVFLRENGLTLVHLRDEPKRAARAYLDSLPGMTGFVAARVALLSCEAHAFPLDTVLCSVLESAGVIDKKLKPDAASTRLERAIRAGSAKGYYRMLERLALENSEQSSGRSRSTSTKRAGRT